MILPAPVLGRYEEIGEVIRRHSVRDVIVAFGGAREDDLVDILRTCDRLHVEVFIVPRLFELHSVNRYTDEIWGIPLARVRRAVFRSGLFVPCREIALTFRLTAAARPSTDRYRRGASRCLASGSAGCGTPESRSPRRCERLVSCSTTGAGPSARTPPPARFSQHHEVVGIPDQPVVRQTVPAATGSIDAAAADRLPPLGEVIVEDRQGDVGQQR